MDGVQGPSQAEMARLQIGDRLAQHLLDQGLGDLLPRFRVQIGALGRKTETVGEARHLVPEQRGTKDDILRPAHLERCHLADALSQSPAAKMFHRSHIGRFGARPEPRDG